MTKLTDTDPAPSTPLKAPSTAEVHAPQVMPSTLRVVVAICAALFRLPDSRSSSKDGDVIASAVRLFLYPSGYTRGQVAVFSAFVHSELVSSTSDAAFFFGFGDHGCAGSRKGYTGVDLGGECGLLTTQRSARTRENQHSVKNNEGNGRTNAQDITWQKEVAAEVGCLSKNARRSRFP